jgi:hypothetical protein
VRRLCDVLVPISGLKVTWIDVKTQNKDKFVKVFPGAMVLSGDTGVMDPMTNHHFVEREDAEPGKLVYSIDGTVGNPLVQQVCPWNSVISERTYGRATLTLRTACSCGPSSPPWAGRPV